MAKKKRYTPKKRQGVRENSDGSVSTHRMAREYIEGKGWVAFPTLFQDDKGAWEDLNPEENQRGWGQAYEKALATGEVYEFGDDEKGAIEFADYGSWKTVKPKEIKINPLEVDPFEAHPLDMDITTENNIKTSSKKYPSGGKVINNFIQSPQEAMYQAQLNYDKAAHEAKSDPWIMGAKIASQAGMQIGMANGGLGSIKGKNGDPLFGQGMVDLMHSGLGMTSNFAMGGAVGPGDEKKRKTQSEIVSFVYGDDKTQEEQLNEREAQFKGLTEEQRIKLAKLGARKGNNTADLIGPVGKVLTQEEIAERFKVNDDGSRLQKVSVGKKQGAWNPETRKYDLEDIIKWQPISEVDYLKTIQGGTVEDYTDVTFAMGGAVQGDVPIEVEKQEVIEDPNGNMMQVDGPSHAQGGVDVNVPEGSMVYSDRIKVDNKSLAKHVAADTKKLDKAKKALEANPTDKINRETVARLEANLEKKKAKFQKLQDIFNSNDPSKQSGQGQPMGGQGMPMQGEQQFMNGGRAQYENGTGFNGVTNDPPVEDYYFGREHKSYLRALADYDEAMKKYGAIPKNISNRVERYSFKPRPERIDDPYAGKMQSTKEDWLDVTPPSKRQQKKADRKYSREQKRNMRDAIAEGLEETNPMSEAEQNDILNLGDLTPPDLGTGLNGVTNENVNTQQTNVTSPTPTTKVVTPTNVPSPASNSTVAPVNNNVVQPVSSSNLRGASAAASFDSAGLLKPLNQIDDIIYGENFIPRGEKMEYAPTRNIGLLDTPEIENINPKDLKLKKTPFKNALNNAKEGLNSLKGPGLTYGDVAGMAGTLYSGIAPMMNTMKNRASDTVNTNMYKNYGLQGLESLSDAEKNLRGTFAENDKAIERQGKTVQAQLDSSSRGINQRRAGRIAAQQGMNQGKNAAWANFAQQQQQLDLQRAGMLNQRDQMVMQGEAAADLANRQDKDNYSTQLGADKANLGAMMQQMGSNLNQSKLGKDKLANLEKYKELYKLGLIDEADYKKYTKALYEINNGKKLQQ